jgi:hypothetical protein
VSETRAISIDEQEVNRDRQAIEKMYLRALILDVR